MTSELPPTEQRNPASSRLGKLSAADVAALMSAEEYRELAAVEGMSALIAVVAEKVASAFRNGGRIVFLAAGTSGWIALQEVAELPPTFGVPADRFTVLVAGGDLMGAAAITRSEDDVRAAPATLHRLGIGAGDVVIALAASGTTPFVRAGLHAVMDLARVDKDEARARLEQAGWYVRDALRIRLDDQKP